MVDFFPLHDNYNIQPGSEIMISKLSSTGVLFLLLFTSCGISQQQEEADAKRREDSLAAAESAMKAAEEAARASAFADSANYSSIRDSIQMVGNP